MMSFLCWLLSSSFHNTSSQHFSSQFPGLGIQWPAGPSYNSASLYPESGLSQSEAAITISWPIRGQHGSRGRDPPLLVMFLAPSFSLPGPGCWLSLSLCWLAGWARACALAAIYWFLASHCCCCSALRWLGMNEEAEHPNEINKVTITDNSLAAASFLTPVLHVSMMTPSPLRGSR